MTKLVQNEQTKLLATGLNNLGIATIVAGAIGPLIAKTYGASGVNGFVLAGLLAVVYLLAGVSLMLIARIVLKDLVE